MFIFCFTFIIIGCACFVHQADAKTKTIQKGITYDPGPERIYIDISKLTPEEGKKALDKLSTGKYQDKALSAVVKAANAASAKKKYIKWGKAYQKLASNPYQLLPYSAQIKTREQKKGYYECYDDVLRAPVNAGYYLERYIDSIFAYDEAQENINDCHPIQYFENFSFSYTDPAGQKHDGKVYMDYMNFTIKSTYSEILSKEQFVQASDAVKIAFLLYPREQFSEYKIGTPYSDCNMKALAEKRWQGSCEDYASLTHQFSTYLSFDTYCQEVFLTSLAHVISFVRAKNSDGEWEYFRTDNYDTAYNLKTGVRYSEVNRLSESDPFLAEAYAYMGSSPTPELTKMSLEYNIKKGLREGCMDETIKKTVSQAYRDGKFRSNEKISYSFVNENDETYGYPVITGAYPES